MNYFNSHITKNPTVKMFSWNQSSTSFTTAKPIFTLYGSGNIGIYLNGNQLFNVSLGDEEYITFDIENMNAYKDTILKNRLVTGNYSNFLLNPGENKISFSGDVFKFEIINYSRWL